MKKINKVIIIMLVFLIPIKVFANTDIELECLDEAMIGNEIYCTIKLNPEEKIKGVFSNYEYDSIFTYSKTELGENWKNITNSSKGFTIVNTNGIEEESELAKIYFMISNDAIPGNEYNFNLKNLQLSNGEKDINLDNKTSKIRILTVEDIVKSMKVNDIKLEIKDGITNYTVTIPNKVTSATISMNLTDEKYQFVDGYGPGTFDNLNVGDNFFTIQIKKDDLVLLKYEICIQRSEKIEEPIEEVEPEITNPKTGNAPILIIFALLIGSVGILVYMNQKKSKEVK